MEKVENMVSCGKRALFIKRVKVELFAHTAYAYIVCDIKRKADELTRAFIAAQEDGISNDEFNESIPTMGKFVLISSEELKKEEVMPLYYTRQYAENLFGISKNNLDLLPLRVHSIETFRGYLMLNFLALIVYTEMNKRLGSKYTVEEALMEMANLKCKVYGDKIIPAEPTKKAKQIMNCFNTVVV
jgi:transposase